MEMFKVRDWPSPRPGGSPLALHAPCPSLPFCPAVLLHQARPHGHDAFVLAASVFPAQSAAPDLTTAFQDQALPVSLQLHHRFT